MILAKKNKKLRHDGTKTVAQRRWHCPIDSPRNNMGSRHSRTAADVSAQVARKDLGWSFRPIIYTMRIFGIDLDLTRQRSVACRRAFLVFGVSSLLCLLALNLMFYCLFPDMFELEQGLNTKYIYIFIHVLSTVVCHMLIEVLVFMMVCLKWRSLWKKMEEIERVLGFPAHFHNQIRKVISFPLAALWIVVNASRYAMVSRARSCNVSSLSSPTYRRSCSIQRVERLWHRGKSTASSS